MNIKGERITNETVEFIPLLSPDVKANPGEPAGSADAYTPEGKAGAMGDADFFRSSLENEKNAAYLKGFTEGEKETLASMSGKLEDQIGRWKKMLAQLSEDVARSQTEFFNAIEERTVSVSVRIAEKLIGHELGANPQYIRDRVKDAVARQRTEPAVAVRVNPKDRIFLHQLVHPAVPRGETAVPAENEFELVEDAAIDPGGFIVETRLAQYDHTISGQLRKIESDLVDLYERNDT